MPHDTELPRELRKLRNSAEGLDRHRENLKRAVSRGDASAAAVILAGLRSGIAEAVAALAAIRTYTPAPRPSPPGTRTLATTFFGPGSGTPSTSTGRSFPGLIWKTAGQPSKLDPEPGATHGTSSQSWAPGRSPRSPASASSSRTTAAGPLSRPCLQPSPAESQQVLAAAGFGRPLPDVLPPVPAAHVHQQFPGALAVHRVQPQHVEEDRLGLAEAAQAPQGKS